MTQVIAFVVLVTYITIFQVINVIAEGDTPFGYGGLDGPSKWATLSPANALCDTGTQQSPVNFASQDVQQNALPADFALPSLTQFNMTNKGHTVEFTPLDDTSGQLRGMTIDGQRFSLQQFHLHTPSEHRVDDVFFDGEMHFVHATADNKISVVAMFIQQSPTDNPIWTNVLNSLPAAPDSTVALSAIFETADVVQATQGGAFTYLGSLTTPPCTEGVRWFVTNTPMLMSTDQLHNISAIIGFSARPVLNNVNVPSTVEGQAPAADIPAATPEAPSSAPPAAEVPFATQEAPVAPPESPAMEPVSATAAPVLAAPAPAPTMTIKVPRVEFSGSSDQGMVLNIHILKARSVQAIEEEEFDSSASAFRAFVALVILSVISAIEFLC